MAPSACQGTVLRPCVFGSLLVLCFFGIYFTYYNMGQFHSSSYVDVTTDPNCSAELSLHGETEAETVLLIWTWPFGAKFDTSCSVFNITRCRLTDDKTLYHEADGVFFHHRDLHGNIADLPKNPRPCSQKWVWLNMESPTNSGPISELNNLFNLTCNYRLDSNIFLPYGQLVPVTAADESFKMPEKDKLVCWIVSNWKKHLKRVQYYDQLKDYVTIHTYGKAFGKDVNDKDYKKIVSGCKFYLSFENSAHKDYITEKLYMPMSLGAVPIVLGTSRQNYEDHIPRDSFIHVDDFSTPKDLAERLQYLDKNNSEYMKYFDWTNKFKVKSSWFGKEHACLSCEYIQKHKGTHQEFRDLNKWYWG